MISWGYSFGCPEETWKKKSKTDKQCASRMQKECRNMAKKSEETFQIKKRFDTQFESATANIPHAFPLGDSTREDIIVNFFSQITLLSSYHVLSPPQEMGEQAFHTIDAIHFWAELPATVVSGIHASRDKSACQYKSCVYIGHKLVPDFLFLVCPSITIQQSSPSS